MMHHSNLISFRRRCGHLYPAAAAAAAAAIVMMKQAQVQTAVVGFKDHG
jgi:hypothetical protein